MLLFDSLRWLQTRQQHHWISIELDESEGDDDDGCVCVYDNKQGGDNYDYFIRDLLIIVIMLEKCALDDGYNETLLFLSHD